MTELEKKQPGRFHIHYHREVPNPFTPPPPTDYEPARRRSPFRTIPEMCRCGHRRVRQAQPRWGYVATDLVVGYWLTTGRWVEQEKLVESMRANLPDIANLR